MIYSEFFNQEHHKHISNQYFINKNKIHLTITFNKSNDFNKRYIIALSKFLTQKSIQHNLYGWICGTKRKYKRATNPHPRKEHAHIIIYSKVKLNNLIDKFFNDLINSGVNGVYSYDIAKIYDIEGLLAYLHDGHHIYESSYYKCKNKIISIWFHSRSKMIHKKVYLLEELETKKDITKSKSTIKKIKNPIFYNVKFKIKSNLKINYYYKFRKYLDSS